MRLSMTLAVAAALAVATAAPALALSCMRPDAVRLYEMARDAEELFVMVRGRIDITGPPVNLTPQTDRDQEATTTARISGTALTSHAFGQDFDREVGVTVQCLGPWCGGLDGLEGEQFAAVQVRGDALVLRIGPCGGDVVNWNRDGERRMLACHRNGICETSDF